MANLKEGFRKACWGMVVVGLIVMKIGPANIARRFDSYWNAAAIAERKDAELLESARKVSEEMVRRFEKPAFPSMP